jgi:hypothetical protein
MKRALLMGLLLLLITLWPGLPVKLEKGGSLILCVGDEPPGLDPTASAPPPSTAWSTPIFSKG